ncbi:hypothetical protein A2U01_0101156, partial [Trifolium medium]|nr:hypothetical protein [Trifolium medium]
RALADAMELMANTMA